MFFIIHVFVQYNLSPFNVVLIAEYSNKSYSSTDLRIFLSKENKRNYSNQNLLTFTDPSYLKNDYKISTTSCLPCSCTTHLLNFDLQQCRFCLLNINLNTIYQTGINTVLEVSSPMVLSATSSMEVGQLNLAWPFFVKDLKSLSSWLKFGVIINNSRTSYLIIFLSRNNFDQKKRS